MDGINYWQAIIVKCGRPGLASSVAVAQNHDEGVGGRSVSEIHTSLTGILNKSVTEGMEK